MTHVVLIYLNLVIKVKLTLLPFQYALLVWECCFFFPRFNPYQTEVSRVQVTITCPRRSRCQGILSIDHLNQRLIKTVILKR